jgi:hypothetical protein
MASPKPRKSAAALALLAFCLLGIAIAAANLRTPAPQPLMTTAVLDVPAPSSIPPARHRSVATPTPINIESADLSSLAPNTTAADLVQLADVGVRLPDDSPTSTDSNQSDAELVAEFAAPVHPVAMIPIQHPYLAAMRANLATVSADSLSTK